jgi:hypothetical protein
MDVADFRPRRMVLDLCHRRTSGLGEGYQGNDLMKCGWLVNLATEIERPAHDEGCMKAGKNQIFAIPMCTLSLGSVPANANSPFLW